MLGERHNIILRVYKIPSVLLEIKYSSLSYLVYIQ